MDLSHLPPTEDFDGTIKKLESLVEEARELDTRMSQVQQEILYYQGVAKALEPEPEGE